MPYIILAMALLISCSTYPEKVQPVYTPRKISQIIPNLPRVTNPCADLDFADDREAILHKLDCLSIKAGLHVK